MKSISQLLDEIQTLRIENDELRKELQKARSNQPQYFTEDGIADAWWFRKSVEVKK